MHRCLRCWCLLVGEQAAGTASEEKSWRLRWRIGYCTASFLFRSPALVARNASVRSRWRLRERIFLSVGAAKREQRSGQPVARLRAGPMGPPRWLSGGTGHRDGCSKQLCLRRCTAGPAIGGRSHGSLLHFCSAAPPIFFPFSGTVGWHRGRARWPAEDLIGPALGKSRWPVLVPPCRRKK